MNQLHKKSVYIIIPVHNRKAITLKCLENLEQNGDLKRYSVVVVDDGSTDGTTAAIQSFYLEVKILAGDGNLWWTGAIKKGMQYAYEQKATFFIWLNDDCFPQSGAIDKLLTLCRSKPYLIVGGQSLDPDTLVATYGGIVNKFIQIKPINTINNNVIHCDGLAGNFVCLSRQVVDDIGYPDEKTFPHYYGDVTYTHSAQKYHYKLLINGEAIAFCRNEHSIVSWLIPDRPLFNYLQDYFQVKSPFYWKAEFFYYKQILGWIGIVMYIYQRVIKFYLFLLISFTVPLAIRQNCKKAFKTI